MSLKAFIKIPVQKGNYKFKQNICARDVEHRIQMSAKFCHICGARVVGEDVDKFVNMTLREMLPDGNAYSLFDYTIEKDFMYIFSKSLEDLDDFSNTFTINSDVVKDVIEEFCQEHSFEIEELEEYLGHKVQVEFGYINIDKNDW